MCFVPLVLTGCIFLLSGDPYRSITSLQLIQNAAPVLTKTGQREHTCPVLEKNHSSHTKPRNHPIIVSKSRSAGFGRQAHCLSILLAKFEQTDQSVGSVISEHLLVIITDVLLMLTNSATST